MSYPYTVEQFREAYKATGLQPLDSCTIDTGDNCGCPQGVLAFHKRGAAPNADEDVVDWVIKALAITDDQFGSFANGFDGGEEWRQFCRTEDHTDAFEVGLACRREFLGID